MVELDIFGGVMMYLAGQARDDGDKIVSFLLGVGALTAAAVWRFNVS